mmetsp:Transcript_26770/g.32448  ORF Transcript_26770/g.32448 Transcript_26770/m.32448 type:complete len:210 (+) Transcript_26770:84-713(+)
MKCFYLSIFRLYQIKLHAPHALFTICVTPAQRHFSGHNYTAMRRHSIKSMRCYRQCSHRIEKQKFLLANDVRTVITPISTTTAATAMATTECMEKVSRRLPQVHSTSSHTLHRRAVPSCIQSMNHILSNVLIFRLKLPYTQKILSSMIALRLKQSNNSVQYRHTFTLPYFLNNESLGNLTTLVIATNRSNRVGIVHYQWEMSVRIYSRG